MEPATFPTSVCLVVDNRFLALHERGLLMQNLTRWTVYFVLGPDQHNISNAVFCSWMAVGNILGFSAGASGSWSRWKFSCLPMESIPIF
jgi:hypothetical protein